MNPNNTQNHIIQQDPEDIKVIKINQPANYQLVQDGKVSQNEICYAIAFNKESNIMVAGCGKLITVFQFQLGQLTKIQFLSDHADYVTSLYFMKKSNEFISGSGEKDDNSVRVWGINNSQQWYSKQVLKGHSDDVRCLIMNANEDLIISCSKDTTIKLWTMKNEWECTQTLTNHTDWVFSINLNDSQNQLVSCGDDKLIIIYQIRVDKQWEMIQTINVETVGIRICFIGDNLITFQPWKSETMLIFQLNQETKQFIKAKEVRVLDTYIRCNQYFPQVFNKQRQILLNSRGETIYLMRLENDSDFVIDQTLKFGTERIVGAMTDDGEYLVTWDNNRDQYEVRRQQQ